MTIHARRPSVRNVIEGLEQRQLMTFAASDPSFGNGGRKIYEAYQFPGDRVPELTPLSDGRILATGAGGVVYLHGNGGLDPKRGKGGIGVTSASPGVAIDMAVDAQTGRVAILRHYDPSDTGTTTLPGYTLDLYDAKGRRTASRSLTTSTAGALVKAGDQPKHIVFQPGGGVFVLSDRFVADEDVPAGVDTPDGDAFAVVHHFDRALQVDSSYGGSGSAVIKYASVRRDSEGDSASLTGLFADASGHAFVTTYFDDKTNSRSGATVSARVTRLTDHGALDTAYGSGGVATIADYNNDADDFTTTRLVDAMRLSPQGELYSVIVQHSSSDYSPSSANIFLNRLSVDGTKTDSIDAGGGERTSDLIGGDVSLAVANDGSAYVAFGGNEIRHFLRTAPGGNFVSDPKWSQFGNVAFTTTTEAMTDLAVDANGRLFLSGFNSRWNSYDLSTLAIKGPTESIAPGAPSNSVQLLPDGTLLINGTSKADRINIRHKAGTAYVTLNGKTYKFNNDRIHGGVIRAGNGNDTINAPLTSRPVYVEAGADDDNVMSAGTLVGGSGNDRLEGGTLGDAIYGQDGNDTLVGGYSTDELFGGNGNDTLYGGIVAKGDFVRDYLNGGRDKDTIYHDDEPIYDDDTIVDDAKGKQIQY